jgi:hypothetical protein
MADRKAIVISGARQEAKTALIKELFGQSQNILL